MNNPEHRNLWPWSQAYHISVRILSPAASVQIIPRRLPGRSAYGYRRHRGVWTDQSAPG